jgi:hypothetical protein
MAMRHIQLVRIETNVDPSPQNHLRVGPANRYLGAYRNAWIKPRREETKDQWIKGEDLLPSVKLTPNSRSFLSKGQTQPHYHQERFPLASIRDRYGFREGTLAGGRANDKVALLPAVRGPRCNREESRFLCRAGEHVFIDLSARSEAIFVPASGNQAL